MPESGIFIVCCGRPTRSLHYVPLTWSSHAGLSVTILLNGRRKMNATTQERRSSARIPADTLHQISFDDAASIDVKVAPTEGTYEQTASLRDIHSSGMCFLLTEHILKEDDIIHIDTMLGDFAFESDAIVRWTMGSYVGVEFLDSRARNAALLAELYTEKLLRYIDEPEQ
ncbi:MAG TPA: PilZ domain-containing protein [Desulfobulbaceae bacterium]|nr:PilZ domain-containing protein [Desulfobulbaceae bacterium]